MCFVYYYYYYDYYYYFTVEQSFSRYATSQVYFLDAYIHAFFNKFEIGKSKLD